MAVTNTASRRKRLVLHHIQVTSVLRVGKKSILIENTPYDALFGTSFLIIVVVVVVVLSTRLCVDKIEVCTLTTLVPPCHLHAFLLLR